jgi:hypothetical protein
MVRPAQGRRLMSDATDLAGRVQQLEAQVAELQKAIEVLVHNPNWRELISLSPSEIDVWAKASAKESTKR